MEDGLWDRVLALGVSTDMINPLPSIARDNEADLFREEAARARRYAAASTDKRIADRLGQIAALYEELAAGQDPGPTDRD